MNANDYRRILASSTNDYEIELTQVEVLEKKIKNFHSLPGIKTLTPEQAKLVYKISVVALKLLKKMLADEAKKISKQAILANIND